MTIGDDLSSEAADLLRIIVFSGAIENKDAIVGFAGNKSDAIAILSQSSLVETDEIIAPTEDGVAVLEETYAQERKIIPSPDREALHMSFKPNDLEIKRLAGAWQQADTADDWEARLSVVESLTALNEITGRFLDQMSGYLPRFHRYKMRLCAALEKISDGETDYFTAVEKDSYHTIWFSLHEDILRLFDKERDPE